MPRTVGCSKNAAIDRSPSKAWLTRDSSRIARSESPPISKNGELAPTRGSPSTSAQIAAIRVSAGPSGAS